MNGNEQCILAVLCVKDKRSIKVDSVRRPTLAILGQANERLTSNMMRSKCLKALAQIHKGSLCMLHLLGDVVVVVLFVKAFAAFAFDHHFVAQDGMADVVNALQVQEKEFAVLGDVFLGDEGRIIFQDDREQFILEKLDLVLEKIQSRQPFRVLFVQLIEGGHAFFFYACVKDRRSCLSES